jgi:hypothetical protein
MLDYIVVFWGKFIFLILSDSGDFNIVGLKTQEKNVI